MLTQSCTTYFSGGRAAKHLDTLKATSYFGSQHSSVISIRTKENDQGGIGVQQT
ncbi:hypothetical protein [Methylomonas fluvii]|nr:hypothetical protein [Methylomonas fluvii]